MWTMMVLIIMMDTINTTTLNLKKMLIDIAKQDFGKYMLTKILCLPLLLAQRRRLEEKDLPQCPLTPHPGLRSGHPPPTNGHERGDTGEKNLVLQPPPEGNRHSEEKNKDESKKERDRKRHKGNVADQGPEAPPGGEGKKPTEEEGSEEGNGGEEDPPKDTPPPPGEGEGEVEEGPKPDPGQGQGPVGLLPSLACHLQRWEDQYTQLVETIVGDLHDYWMKLKIPQ